MKAWGLILSALVLVCTGCVCTGCAATVSARPPDPDMQISPRLPDPPNFDRAGVDVIRGFFAPGRQPDGNTVILASAGGLIVFDTGRHADHAQKIADIARSHDAPVLAIINSHWHLDHISGNIPLRKMWPGATVYSNDAALTDALGSFLARGLESNRTMAADPATPPALADDLRGDIVTVEQGALLHPGISVEGPVTLNIAGRVLQLHTASAASAGDIWLYDPAARLIASGDLVTLPAPFLDTACPAKWSAALEDVLAQPFERLVPGHGREMTRADVMLYRDAFNALLRCAASDAEASACAEAWAGSIGSLLDDQSGDAVAAKAYAGYYAGLLRQPGARPVWCA
ncbi:MAG: MBL fold metallo-hydrolase [Hyphomonadaceae bacterium]